MILSCSNRVLRFVTTGGFSIARRNKSVDAPMDFSDEQKITILRTLNNAPPEELKRFMGKMFLRRFLKHREAHGPFESIEGISSIESITPRGLAAMYGKMLRSAGKSLAFAQAIKPALTERRAKMINNAASVNLNPPFLTVVKMDVDMRVLQWKRFRYKEEQPENAKPTKMTVHEAFDLARSFYPKLPQADIFILCSDGSARPLDSSFGERQLLQNILYTMLNFGEPETERPKVVIAKSSVLATYYNLRMGSDQISCQDVFLELLEKNEIKLPRELRESYEQHGGVGREFFATTTLLCRAFLEARQAVDSNAAGIVDDIKDLACY